MTAIEDSATAIARLRGAAEEELLAVEALDADVTRFSIRHDYYTIVAIGDGSPRTEPISIRAEY